MRVELGDDRRRRARRAAQEPERPLLERAWIKANIDRLSTMLGEESASKPAAAEDLSKQILDLSIRYRVLSDYTALLVLETEYDYRALRHRPHRARRDPHGRARPASRRRPQPPAASSRRDRPSCPAARRGRGGRRLRSSPRVRLACGSDGDDAKEPPSPRTRRTPTRRPLAPARAQGRAAQMRQPPSKTGPAYAMKGPMGRCLRATRRWTVRGMERRRPPGGAVHPRSADRWRRRHRRCAAVPERRAAEPTADMEMPKLEPPMTKTMKKSGGKDMKPRDPPSESAHGRSRRSWSRPAGPARPRADFEQPAPDRRLRRPLRDGHDAGRSRTTRPGALREAWLWRESEPRRRARPARARRGRRGRRRRSGWPRAPTARSSTCSPAAPTCAASPASGSSARRAPASRSRSTPSRRRSRSAPITPRATACYAFALQGRRHAEAFAAMLAGAQRELPGGRFAGVDRILREDLACSPPPGSPRDPIDDETMRAELAARRRHARPTSPRCASCSTGRPTPTTSTSTSIDGKGGHAYYSTEALPSRRRALRRRHHRLRPRVLHHPGQGRRVPLHPAGPLLLARPDGLRHGQAPGHRARRQRRLYFEERPFVIMKDGAFVDLGRVDGPLASLPATRLPSGAGHEKVPAGSYMPPAPPGL